MGQTIFMRAATAGGTENAIASVDVPTDGELIGVEWSARASYDTTGDDITFQLSFGSVSVDSNDSRQVISNFTLGTFVFTAGGTEIAGMNGWTKLPDIPVSGGERIFLHSIATANVVAVARVMLHFSFDLDRPKARRR